MLFRRKKKEFDIMYKLGFSWYKGKAFKAGDYYFVTTIIHDTDMLFPKSDVHHNSRQWLPISDEMKEFYNA